MPKHECKRCGAVFEALGGGTCEHCHRLELGVCVRCGSGYAQPHDVLCRGCSRREYVRIAVVCTAGVALVAGYVLLR